MCRQCLTRNNAINWCQFSAHNQQTFLSGEVVAEYTGERICSEEAARREAIYQEQENHPPAMFEIYGGAGLQMM